MLLREIISCWTRAQHIVQEAGCYLLYPAVAALARQKVGNVGYLAHVYWGHEETSARRLISCHTLTSREPGNVRLEGNTLSKPAENIDIRASEADVFPAKSTKVPAELCSVVEEAEGKGRSTLTRATIPKDMRDAGSFPCLSTVDERARRRASRS